MEIIGKVKQVCDLMEGSSAAGDWCKKDVVVTTVGDDPHDIAVTFFGERRIEKLTQVKVGDLVQVFATVKSRTNDNVRWFTTVDAQSITVMQKQPQQTRMAIEDLPPDDVPY